MKRLFLDFDAPSRASEDAQAFVTAGLTQMLPDTAAWAATLPPGILTLRPWLVPARAVR